MRSFSSFEPPLLTQNDDASSMTGSSRHVKKILSASWAGVGLKDLCSLVGSQFLYLL